MAMASRIETTFEPLSGIRRVKAFITVAEIVALGASTTGEIGICTIPAGALMLRVSVTNGGTAFATINTLTASVGINGATTAFMAAETIYAANANAQTGVSVAAQQIYAETAAKAIVVEFTGGANLDTTTGGSPGGVRVDLAWIERM